MIPLQTLVVAFYGSDHNAVRCIGEAVTYLGEPSYGIKLDEETTVDWAASLVRPATPEEQVIYWKERALRAEGSAA